MLKFFIQDRQIDILKDNLSDNDQDQVRIRGTEKLVEKYRCELKESHMKIRELRQQVFELSSIKVGSIKSNNLKVNLSFSFLFCNTL